MNNRKKDISRLNIRMLVALSFICAFMFLFGGTVSADLKDFDHFDTGFPLSGKHTNTACDSCHINGVFKGTPKECSACHNEQIALGKNNTHIPSSDECDDCHTTFNFSKATVDHDSVVGLCSDCHEKPRDHVPTDSQCDDCHNTFSWSSVTRFDHDNLTQTCESVGCHWKTPRPRNHVESMVCGNCHTPTSWGNVTRFDHSDVTECRSCHGANQDYDPKPAAFHSVFTAECDACHTNVGLNWNFNHSAGSNVERCVVCHDGSGSVPGAAGKSNNHPPASDDCADCHTTNTFVGAGIDHSTVTQCRSCHGPNQKNDPNPPAFHSRFSNECDDCHTNAGVNWNFNHNAGSGAVSCVTCHDGGVSGAARKGANHIVSSDDCASCHNTNNWDAQIDHSNLTECLSCHGPNQANDPNPRNHGDFSGIECDACHNNAGRSWRFSHRGAENNTNVRCDTCHGSGGISVKRLPGDHPNRNGKDCGDSGCHSTNGW